MFKLIENFVSQRLRQHKTKANTEKHKEQNKQTHIANSKEEKEKGAVTSALNTKYLKCIFKYMYFKYFRTLFVLYSCFYLCR